MSLQRLHVRLHQDGTKETDRNIKASADASVSDVLDYLRLKGHEPLWAGGFRVESLNPNEAVQEAMQEGWQEGSLVAAWTQQEGGKHQLKLFSVSSEPSCVPTCPKTSIEQVLNELQERLGLSPPSVMLIFDGERLSPEQTIGQCQIKEGDVLHVKFRMFGMCHPTSGRRDLTELPLRWMLEVMLPEGLKLNVPVTAGQTYGALEELVNSMVGQASILSQLQASKGANG